MTAERFTVSHARDAQFERGLRSFFEYRDLGIENATKGQVVAHVIRAARVGASTSRLRPGIASWRTATTWRCSRSSCRRIFRPRRSRRYFTTRLLSRQAANRVTTKTVHDEFLAKPPL